MVKVLAAFTFMVSTLGRYCTRCFAILFFKMCVGIISGVYISIALVI